MIKTHLLNYTLPHTKFSLKLITAFFEKVFQGFFLGIAKLELSENIK